MCCLWKVLLLSFAPSLRSPLFQLFLLSPPWALPCRYTSNLSRHSPQKLRLEPCVKELQVKQQLHDSGDHAAGARPSV